MLSANVLCLKTRRKRSYYVSEAADYIRRKTKDKRPLGDSPAMMQITEDTPPDMLAGAMDLTVHLPTGRTVKMSVDRSTPMMDLLVQITTAHHLQQSGHTLQALEMAPSSGRMDRILPYKPNTPIGVLDTQHVKVFPKNRSTLGNKGVSTGHQPFESTFRLQVHLPRNQLYVIRVSQNVHLGDIMKKVCLEKNLDSSKYECRHPGNLNEVLDPKLTLSDYQITEVYIVFKGTVGLTQAFSANDIMALRKEEERKQLQARTGGGVFSLIFKRGKQSTGSGSLSSENRSISPSHSDDSRSVTPPAIQQQILSLRTQEKAPAADKPKAPQRKRRPAPKPPQQTEPIKDTTEKPPSQISNASDSNTSTLHPKKFDSGLTICHSRNSSDSSGYHEPSVLSENCNTSLPRRPKSTLINEVVDEEVQENLTKMSTFSKSSSSITGGRKKKAAPAPPPLAIHAPTPPAVQSSAKTVVQAPAPPTFQAPAPPAVQAPTPPAVQVAAPPTVQTPASPVVQAPAPPVAQDPASCAIQASVPEKTVAASSVVANVIVEKQVSPVPVRRKKLASKPPKPAPRVKSVIVEKPIPQARNSVISIEEPLQLDAEKTNLLPNQACTFEKNISDNKNEDNKELIANALSPETRVSVIEENILREIVKVEERPLKSVHECDNLKAANFELSNEIQAVAIEKEGPACLAEPGILSPEVINPEIDGNSVQTTSAEVADFLNFSSSEIIKNTNADTSEALPLPETTDLTAENFVQITSVKMAALPYLSPAGVKNDVETLIPSKITDAVDKKPLQSTSAQATDMLDSILAEIESNVQTNQAVLFPDTTEASSGSAIPVTLVEMSNLGDIEHTDQAGEASLPSYIQEADLLLKSLNINHTETATQKSLDVIPDNIQTEHLSKVIEKSENLENYTSTADKVEQDMKTKNLEFDIKAIDTVEDCLLNYNRDIASSEEDKWIPKKVDSDSLSLQLELKPPQVVAFHKKSKSLTNLYTFATPQDENECRRDASNFEDNLDNLSILSVSSVDDGEPSGKLASQAFQKHSQKRHSLHIKKTYKKNNSIISLRSSESMPNILEQANIKKWNNTQELDHISVHSDCTDLNLGKWIVGDSGDAESGTTPQTNRISNETIPDASIIDDVKNNNVEALSSQATEAVNLQEVPKPPTPNNVSSKRTSQDSSAQVSQTPTEIDNSKKHTPEPLILSISPELDQVKQEENPELVELENDWQYQLPSPPKAFRDMSPTNLTDVTNYDTVTLHCFKDDSVVTNLELFEKLGNVKDSQYESGSISDLSSVCNDDEKQILSKLTLENLEKRKSLVYNRELSTSLKIAQNDFSSRDNETRNINGTSSQRSSIVNELEQVIKSSNRTLARHNSCVLDNKTLKPYVDNNLPNFKISTYDNLKRKINIFEDESIRSNSENTQPKRQTSVDLSSNKSMPYQNISSQRPYKTDDNTYMRRSVENISQLGLQVNEIEFKKPIEFSKYKTNSKNNFYVKHKNGVNNVSRSESFAANHDIHSWKPLNPVQRSISQLDLNKPSEEEALVVDETDSNLVKSNSLFDVSGLQSLEVMRSIQNKLNTPNNSTEQLLSNEVNVNSKESSRKNSVNSEASAASTTDSTSSKTYRYQGPPSINLSTWSERPKTKVSLKEDTDYKIKNIEANQLNGVEPKPRSNSYIKSQESKTVNVKINGSEPITGNESGNVVIKIGNAQFPKLKPITKFNQPDNVEFRKPLGNVNKISINSRPHSIAFESDFDISRVPIVRAVELKKTVQDVPVGNNTSVTQINAINNQISNKYSDIYQSSESVQEVNSLRNSLKSTVYLSAEPTPPPKPVARGNSFAYSRTVPKVMGFKDIQIENDNTPRSRKSWNVPHSFESLPMKLKPEPPAKPTTFTPNSNVPFSQVNLKRVESHRISLPVNKTFGNVVLRNTQTQNKNDVIKNDLPKVESNKLFNGVAPPAPRPPPVMPSAPKKVLRNPQPCGDPHDELLNSIRNFGGKKGLRNVKAV